MSTRLISIISMFGGLVLLGVSSGEIRRVRQDYLQLEAAQQLSANLSDEFAKYHASRRGEFPFRRAPDVLGNSCDDDSRREMMPWRITLGIGAALFGGGLLGLARKRGLVRSHGSNRLATENPSSSFRSHLLPRSVLYFVLFGIGVFTVCVRISLERHDPPAPLSSVKIPDVIYRLPGAGGIANWYSRAAEGVSAIKVPYNRADGPWIALEESLGGFAQSNGIQIVRFEGAGSQEAYVCVKREGASAMKKFVRSMSRSANKPGPANQSRAVASDTNLTPVAVGFGR